MRHAAAVRQRTKGLPAGCRAHSLLRLLQDIHQIIEICAPYDKMHRLTDFLRSKPRGYKCIVFCGTKRMCDQVRRQVDKYSLWRGAMGSR